MNNAHVKYQNSNFITISLTTDCEMPIMDGIKVTEEILARRKKSLRGQKLIVYGLTGHVEFEYKKKCFEAGMKDVLEKPLTFERIKSLLLGGFDDVPSLEMQ